MYKYDVNILTKNVSHKYISNITKRQDQDLHTFHIRQINVEYLHTTPTFTFTSRPPQNRCTEPTNFIDLTYTRIYKIFHSLTKVLLERTLYEYTMLRYSNKIQYPYPSLFITRFHKQQVSNYDRVVFILSINLMHWFGSLEKFY